MPQRAQAILTGLTARHRKRCEIQATAKNAQELLAVPRTHDLPPPRHRRHPATRPQAADLAKAWHLDDNGPAVVDFAETLPPAACRTERRTAPVRRASMMG
jgi:hypothetical protein